MVRIFNIIDEFEKYETEYDYMMIKSMRNYYDIVCYGDLIYIPVEGGRVFAVDNIVVPSRISLMPTRKVELPRSINDNIRKTYKGNYIGIDRKNMIALFKLPGMEEPLILKIFQIKSESIQVTNFDKKAGY